MYTFTTALRWTKRTTAITSAPPTIPVLTYRYIDLHMASVMYTFTTALRWTKRTTAITSAPLTIPVLTYRFVDLAIIHKCHVHIHDSPQMDKENDSHNFSSPDDSSPNVQVCRPCYNTQVSCTHSRQPSDGQRERQS